MRHGEQKAPELLREAARLINRALLQLDATSAPCMCCGRTLNRNKVHGHALDHLGAVVERLNDWAGKVEAAVDDKGTEAFRKSHAVFMGHEQ